MMKRTKVLIGLIAIALFLTGAIHLLTKEQSEEEGFTGGTSSTVEEGAPTPSPDTGKTPTTTKPSTGTQKPTTLQTNVYTKATVALHNDSTSCWTIVNGNVYDVTSWINQHPGGKAAIKGMCGIDASAQFNAQHGGQTKPEQILASFKIGILG